ncbi:hypothetical protein VTJ49DRAFT_6777 [Mycothermus thermophilus]|uniref:Major facilitator superfamily (MFS) profile domain-containing protein n=1 Tax=Humicola insolens TaxID=85995 RepID=A0ABR3V1E1_HUMIN
MSSPVTVPDAVARPTWAKDSTPEHQPNVRQDVDRTDSAGTAGTITRSTSSTGPAVELGPVEEWKPGKMEYAVMLTLALISLMVALDATILVSVLPTLAQDLGGSSTDAFWAGTSYLLSCAVCQPFIAALSDIFGRREMLISSLLFFTLGTLLCAPVAKSFTVFFVGRSIQGIGGGGIITLGQVIYSDIVPLRQRPKYFSMVLAAWALGSVLGPLIGGLFVERADWSWCFYINFPFCALGLLLVPIYVRLTTAKTSFASKLERIDWIGGIFFIGGLTSFLIGISWGGIQYEWSSGEAITPIVAGVLSIIVALMWEVYGRAREPFLRPSLFTSLSALATYMAAMFQGFILFCGLYYMPFYFTAVKFDGPTQSGLDIFPVTCFLLPGSIVISVLTTRLGRYRWAIWSGWAVTAVACGLLVMFDADIKTPIWAVILAVFGIGHGMLLTSVNVGIQAVSRVEDSGRAAAMYAFMRTLGMSIGVAIGGTVFQNVMRNKLNELGLPEEIARDSEAYVRQMALLAPNDPTRLAAVEAYLAGFHGVFWTITGAACAAFLVCLVIRHGTMDKDIETRFVLEGGRGDHGPGGAPSAGALSAGGPPAGAPVARGASSGSGSGEAIELGNRADRERQTAQQQQQEQQQHTRPVPCLPPIEVQHGLLDLDWDGSVPAAAPRVPAPVARHVRLPPPPPDHVPAPVAQTPRRRRSPSPYPSSAAPLPTGPFGPKCDACKNRPGATSCCVGSSSSSSSSNSSGGGGSSNSTSSSSSSPSSSTTNNNNRAHYHPWSDPFVRLNVWRQPERPASPAAQETRRGTLENGVLELLLRKLELETGTGPRLGSWASKLHPLLELVLRSGEQQQEGKGKGKEPVRPPLAEPQQEGGVPAPAPRRRDTWLTEIDAEVQPVELDVGQGRATSDVVVIPPAIRDLVAQPPRPVGDDDEEENGQGGFLAVMPPAVRGLVARLRLRGGEGGEGEAGPGSSGGSVEEEPTPRLKRTRRCSDLQALLQEPVREDVRLLEETGPLWRVRRYSDLQTLLASSSRQECGRVRGDFLVGPDEDVEEEPAPTLQRTRRSSNLQGVLQDAKDRAADEADGGGEPDGDDGDEPGWSLFVFLPAWLGWIEWLWVDG